MARKKISEFNRVVPNSEDRIIIEQNGMGRSAALSSLPVSNPTMEALNDVRKDVTKVYKFKGTVVNKTDLPATDIVVGDAYNVSSEGKTYAYTGSSWIAIGVDAVTDEVLQAREGYDGTIYSDLGTAIRTQVSNLKTSQDQVAEELKADLGELITENNALKVEVARNKRQIENLNDRLDGDLIENKYKMTGETPDEPGVLSLPSSKLLPWAEIDEVHGRTWVWNQLVDQSVLRTIQMSINENLAICQSVVEHIYLIIFKASANSTFRLMSGTVTLKYMDSNTPSDMSSVEKISGESIFIMCPYGGVITITTLTIIDLTTLFGVTEVAQVTDWMKAWVKDYAEAHPQYDAGTLISASNVNVKSVGKNLLNSVLESSSEGGITCIRKGDGIYTINGTVSASAYPEFILGRITLKAGTYTISNESYDGDNPYIWIGDESSPNGIVNNFWSGNKTFTLMEKKTVRITFVGTPSQTFSNKVIKPMLEEGSVATDYSPYISSTLDIPSDWYTKASALGYDLGMEGTVIDFNEKKVTWTYGEASFSTATVAMIAKEIDGSTLLTLLIASDATQIRIGNIISDSRSIAYYENYWYSPNGAYDYIFTGFTDGSGMIGIWVDRTFSSLDEATTYVRSLNETMVYELATPITKTFAELGFEPIDNGLPIESNGTITVISEDAQAEAMIHYAIDNRSTT